MTTFAKPINNVKTTLASNRSIGGDLVVVDASAITLSPGEWIRVTLLRNSDGAIAILKCTAVTGNTLTFNSAIEGTSDIAGVSGDKVEMRLTAGALTDIHTAVNTLEASVASKADASSVYTTTQTDTLLAAKATTSALTSHTTNTSNPHSVTATQVGAYTSTQTDTLLAGKAASSHTHTASQVTDFAEAVDDRVAALLVQGSNVSLTYNDATNSLTIAATGSGGASALDDLSDVTITSPSTGHLIRYNGTQWVNTTLVAGDIPTIAQSQVTGLTTSLAAKALDSDLVSHTSNSSNPHNVTAAQVGSATAQWNASKIQGVTVDASGIANNKILKYNSTSGNLEYATDNTGSGVTSVDLAVPSGLSVSGNPITSSGTITISTSLSGIVKGTGTGFAAAVASDVATLLGSQTTNLVYASPNGSSGTPSFRALVAADIPSLAASKITSGQLSLAQGGTGADLSATGGTGRVLKQTSTGAVVTVATLTTGDMPGAVVQSISLATPNVIFATPVTFSVTSGAATGTLSLNTQTANTVLCGPTTGSAATPAFRSLVVADLPTTGLNITSHYGTITTDTDGATVTFDLATSDWHQVQLGGNRTLALSNPTIGQQFCVILQQDGTGSRTVTWFSGILWVSGTIPTLTTTASKRDLFVFKCISSGVYLGFIAGQNI